jgi:hypothetical protein
MRLCNCFKRSSVHYFSLPIILKKNGKEILILVPVEGEVTIGENQLWTRWPSANVAAMTAYWQVANQLVLPTWPPRLLSQFHSMFCVCPCSRFKFVLSFSELLYSSIFHNIGLLSLEDLTTSCPLSFVCAKSNAALTSLLCSDPWATESSFAAENYR